jgi:hypothetical protein
VPIAISRIQHEQEECHVRRETLSFRASRNKFIKKKYSNRKDRKSQINHDMELIKAKQNDAPCTNLLIRTSMLKRRNLLVVLLLLSLLATSLAFSFTLTKNWKEWTASLLPAFGQVVSTVSTTTLQNDDINNEDDDDNVNDIGEAELEYELQQNIQSPSSSSSLTAPKLPQLLFVHIGKTGGQTIKSVLYVGCTAFKNKRVRQPCLDRLPESALSDAVLGYAHCYRSAFHRMDPSQWTGFLITTRSPLERAISWYYYVHPAYHKPKPKRPKKKHTNATLVTPTVRSNRSNRVTTRRLKSKPMKDRMYSRKKPDKSPPNDGIFLTAMQISRRWSAQFFHPIQCAGTLHGWIRALELEDDSETNTTSPLFQSCREMARCTVYGQLPRQVMIATHMIANIAYYYNQTIAQWPNKTVYIVRTNELWHDMQAIDRMLGGTGDFQNWTGHQETHGSELYTVTRKDDIQNTSANATQSASATDSISTNKTSTSAAASFLHDLSIHERRTMCCALVHELVVYRDIVMRAVNLSPIEAEETWNSALTDCGIDVSISSSWDDFQAECQPTYDMLSPTCLDGTTSM